MRVTNTGLISTQIYQTQRNLQRMGKLNEQLNTGKEINRVSDDPYKARRIMGLKNEIAYTEKYNENIDEVSGWLDNTDATLDKTGMILNDFKESILQVGNGAYSETEMKSIAKEMDEKVKQLGDVLNNAYGDKYLMAGTELEEPPIIINEGPPTQLEINPNIRPEDLQARLNIEISENINVDYSFSVDDILGIERDANGNITSNGFLDTINNISTTMNDIANGVDVEENKNKLLFNDDSLKTELDDFFNYTVNIRTEVGTNMEKLEKVKDLNDNNLLEMEKLLSVNQDTDYAEKLVEYSTAQMIYQASLKVSSKLIQPTLMDFI